MSQHPELERRIAEAVAAVDFGRPGYRARGRNPRFPYVPVLNLDDGRERQVLRRAYVTSEEAVAAAARHLEALRLDLAAKLAERRYRSLREWHGLPRELDDLLAPETTDTPKGPR